MTLAAELNLSFKLIDKDTSQNDSTRIIHNIKRAHYIRPAQCANHNNTHTNRASWLNPGSRFKSLHSSLTNHNRGSKHGRGTSQVSGESYVDTVSARDE